jgi:hypothetical protein
MLKPILVSLYALNDGMFEIFVRPDQITHVLVDQGPEDDLITIYVGNLPYTISKQELSKLLPFMTFLYSQKDVDRYLEPDIPF